VDGIVGKCKTETSRRPVPIDELTTAELLAWKRETCYAEPADWVFASERVQGKMPPWADTLLDRFLQPAAKRAGITKWVGFHTFRHTYSTLLKSERGRCQSGAGIDAPRKHLHDDEHLHEGSDFSQAGSAKPGGRCSFGSF
jgi:integrase